MRREKNSAAALVCAASADRIMKLGRLARLLCVMAICLFASLAHAQTYYVSQNGSDSNPGTADAAFRTINGALSFIGTAPARAQARLWRLPVALTMKVFTSIFLLGFLGISFHVTCATGDVVIIKPDAFGNAVADGMDYYSVIDGFVFDGANTWQHQIVIGNCCDPQTRFVRFQNNELINNRFGGFFVSGNNIEVVNNRVHGGFEEWAGCGQEHCFGYAFYVEGSNNLFSGNQIDDVPSWVFHVYNYYGSAHYNIVESNTIHTFGFGDHRADGIFLSSGVGNEAYNNVIYNGSGGIALWRCDGCVMSNNTVSTMDVCLEVAD